MSEDAFDVVIVGGGPGGYVAAIRARQLGLKTALVEREHLGGVCLNWGCIPTKTLLRTAEVYRLLHRLDDFGLAASEVGFDLQKVVGRSRAVARRLSGGVRYLMKKNGVALFEGHGRLNGKGRLQIIGAGESTTEVEAPHIILATGARPSALPGVELDGRLVWSYKEAMIPDVLPRSLLVVGSGAVGVEFASFYCDMGAEVSIVEVLPSILPFEDEEISALARKSFEKRGMKIHTAATIQSVQKGAHDVTAAVDFGNGSVSRITVERVIVAVGITGNVEDLGIEGTGVRVDQGHIAVNEWLETGEAGVYAIGDLAGPPWLAHKASHEGIVCVERIAGLSGVRPLDRSRIPSCTYCRPQIASVGATEAEAKASGHEVRVGHFPFQANGKAIALGEPEGMVKTVFDAESGELLGAHMIGVNVTELIHGCVVARTMEATEAELIHAIFAHPTLAETMHESVLDAYGRVLHL